MKIAVIGFGQATIGFLEEFKNTEHEITVFEKSDDIYSSSISGIRSDGKLFVSSNMGGDIAIPISEQREVVDFYISKLNSENTNNIQFGKSFSKESKFYTDFYQNGFEPVESNFWHIGTDKLKDILVNIYTDLAKAKNIIFKFGKRITAISPNSVTYITHNYVDTYEYFDHIIVGVGRSGFNLIKSIQSVYPNQVTSGNTVDIGIRFELPNHLVKELNEEMYEFKVRMKSKTGYIVRTFCNNPSGQVVLERYDDFVTVNGHSNSISSSINTNFAILCTTSFTEPFNDPVGYGTYISRLSNILQGGNKVLLQTYGDFKNVKRTKKLGRVIPTLPSNEYVLGDINLVLPRRITESIIEFIERLGQLIPGITYSDNLLYATEVKFYSNKMDNKQLSTVKFIGDCSGYTRSITYATQHGKQVAKELKNLLV